MKQGKLFRFSYLHALVVGWLLGKANAILQAGTKTSGRQMVEWLARALDYLFGCGHRNLSRVFTIRGESYRVCYGCGAEFRYSLVNMSIEHRTATPRSAVTGGSTCSTA
jgi:hypothetical protein